MPDFDPAADPPEDAPDGAVAVADAPPETADSGKADSGAPPEGGGATSLPAEEIEALLAAASAGSVVLPEEDEGDAADGDADAGADDESAEPAPAPPAAADGPSAGSPIGGSVDAPAAPPIGGQVDRLLEEVEAGLRNERPGVLPAGSAPPADLGSPAPLALEQFAGDAAAAAGGGAGLGALDDVELDLRIELGRTEMRLEDVVNLRDGSVVTLDKLAGDPVDILVNGRLVARGEVLVLNDNFCVRVAEILDPDR